MNSQTEIHIQVITSTNGCQTLVIMNVGFQNNRSIPVRKCEYLPLTASMFASSLVSSRLRSVSSWARTSWLYRF